MLAAAAIRFLRTKALLKRCYVMQAAEVLRTRYVEVPEALLGALKMPTATELQPLLSQLAEVDALKQKGNECAHQFTSFVTEGLLSRARKWPLGSIIFLSNKIRCSSWRIFAIMIIFHTRQWGEEYFASCSLSHSFNFTLQWQLRN